MISDGPQLLSYVNMHEAITSFCLSVSLSVGKINLAGQLRRHLKSYLTC